MDFLALQTAVFGELGEDSSNPVFYSLADVKDAINEGYKEMSEISEWNEINTAAMAFSAVNAGVRWYDSFNPNTNIDDPEILCINKIYVPSLRRWLLPTSTQMLDAANPTWELATGAPEFFMVRGMFRFGVYPLPTISDSITIYCRTIPSGAGGSEPLILDGDTPGFPTDFHHGIVAYATYRLLCEDAEYKKAMSYYVEFQAAADLLKKWSDNRGAIPMTRVLGGGGMIG